MELFSFFNKALEFWEWKDCADINGDVNYGYQDLLKEPEINWKVFKEFVGNFREFSNYVGILFKNLWQGLKEKIHVHKMLLNHFTMEENQSVN